MTPRHRRERDTRDSPGVDDPTTSTRSTGAGTTSRARRRVDVAPDGDSREGQADGHSPSTAVRSGGPSLVVLDPDDPSATLRAALRHPAVDDGDLQLLVVFPTVEYEARRRARQDAGLTAPYAIYHLEDEARRIAERVGREWLDPTGDAFESMGAVGRLRDSVRVATATRDYACVFVPRSERTIWQRLLGKEAPSASLTRVLPAGVPVVSVDATLGSVPDVEDRAAIPDLTVAPETPVRR